jgi:very-short-patch-repair endonuclease
MKNGIREFYCAGCGKFVRKSCTKNVKYCSPECYHQHKEPNYKKNGVYLVCVNCGKRFYVPLCRAKKAITCCVNCANEYQSRNKVHLVCEVCGKDFVRSPSFDSQKYCSIACRNKSDSFKKHLVQMNARQSKNFPNRFEIAAYKLLSDLKIEFIPQYIINEKFTVDAFIPGKNVVVQFDGDYWHGNPSMYPNPDQRQRKRMGLDISQDAYMKKLGFRVIRIWQSDFTNIKNVESILSVI